MIILRIIINNQKEIIDFISKFSKNFDIIYFDKDISFDVKVILQLDKYNDYTTHEITNKYITLISTKEEFNLFRQYDENEGIKNIYIEEHLSRVRKDINYCINLMWVSADPLFSNNFLIHPKYFNKIEMWINNNPNAKIIFWYDGDTKFTTFFSIINTRLFFDHLNSKNTGKIYLRDLSINPLVMKINELAPFLFGPVRLFTIDDNRLPLYYRVDLYRIIIAIYLLKYEDFSFFVYSDMDIEPYCNNRGNKIRCTELLSDKIELNKKYIFNKKVMSYLDEDSLVMQSMGKIHSKLPSYENGFQIIGNKDPNKKKLIVAAFQIYILYNQMQRNLFFNDFGDITLDNLKHQKNSRTQTLRHNFSSNVQNIYGSYMGALILYKNLLGIYKLTNWLGVDQMPSIKEHIEKDFYSVTIKETNNVYIIVHSFLVQRLTEKIKIYNFAYFTPSNFINIHSESFNDAIYKKKYNVDN